MVRSMKRCLKKTIGGAKLTYEELMTVTVEMEMIFNSRPLSYVSSEDLDEPLTPSHFLNGRRLLSLPDRSNTGDLSDPDVELSSTDLSKRTSHLDGTDRTNHLDGIDERLSNWWSSASHIDVLPRVLTRRP